MRGSREEPRATYPAGVTFRIVSVDSGIDVSPLTDPDLVIPRIGESKIEDV